jgi:hypothetical protein
MTATGPRFILVALLVGLALAMVLPREAAAATNPRIVGVSLVAGHEFTAGTALCTAQAGWQSASAVSACGR